MDIEMIRNQIKGIKGSIEELREKEKRFVKASTLDEEIEKIRADTDDLKGKLAEAKEHHSDALRRRENAVRTSLATLETVVDKLLPFGSCFMSLTEDGRLEFGWKINDTEIPYWALSGGQKMIFDPALSFALLGRAEYKVIVIEGAEMDTAHLTRTLQKIAEDQPAAQIICNTWHGPEEVHDWEVISLVSEQS